MTLGADQKKVMWLVGIVVVGGGYAVYSNLSDSRASSSPSQPRPTKTTAPAIPYAEPQAVLHRAPVSSHSNEEFKPSLKPKRQEDRVDPMTIDPTLRLDLLAKVQAVEMQGGSRNLFQVGQAPPPPLPKEPAIQVARTQIGPNPKPAALRAANGGAPPAPPPPPITLKYYGYSSAKGDNKRRAFFLDGEEILVGAEGDLVKKRYKVVRIGVNSVTMEDTQFKHEQTLQLTEEPGVTG